MEPIAIPVVFDTFRSLKDGGINFTLSTHEGQAETVAKLSRLKGEALYCVLMTEEQFEATR